MKVLRPVQQHVHEGFLADRHTRDRAFGDRRGRARLLVDGAHLAEVFASTQDGDALGFAVPPLLDDFHPAVSDEVGRVARIAFSKDHRAVLEIMPLHSALLH
jgi:hypothetical protein